MWTCPECGSKVDASFDLCWRCGTDRDGTRDPNFRSADRQGPIDPLPVPDAPEVIAGHDVPGGELVACYQAFSLMEAQFLTDQLTEAGISAVCDDQDMQDAIGGWSGNPRVYCRESNLDAARAFLAEYEKRKSRHDPLE